MLKYTKNDYIKIACLVAECQSGNEAALPEIINAFQCIINKYCYLNGKKDEDLYSELLIALFKCVNKFRVDEKPYIQLFNSYEPYHKKNNDLN